MDRERYRRPDPSLWQGRINGPTAKRFHEIVECKDIEDAVEQAYGLIGFACDEGVKRNKGRRGAYEGPAAFRKAFGKLPTTLPTFYDFGDIVCDDEDLDSSQQALAQAIAQLYQKGIFPIVIGGGHEVAWGHYQGIHENCAIVNIDAHFDLRPLEDGKGSSGTPFTQIAQEAQDKFSYYCIGIQEHGNTKSLFDEADRLHVKYLLAQDIDKTASFVEEILNQHQHIYLTICMDVFAAPYAPGVSAPQPLGLVPQKVIPIIQQLAKSGQVIAFDIAELSPPYDRDGVTAALTAALVSEFLHHTSL